MPVTPGADGQPARAQVRVSHFHGLKRLVAGLAGVVTVVDPGQARQTVADWAAAGAARYDVQPTERGPAAPDSAGGAADGTPT